jgi:hypothetical protein
VLSFLKGYLLMVLFGKPQEEVTIVEASKILLILKFLFAVFSLQRRC